MKKNEKVTFIDSKDSILKYKFIPTFVNHNIEALLELCISTVLLSEKKSYFYMSE